MIVTQFRLLRPIAARAISGVVAATGDVSASTVTDPPSWAAPAVQPGWVYQEGYTVGAPMTADFGAALNSPNPSGYSIRCCATATPLCSRARTSRASPTRP